MSDWLLSGKPYSVQSEALKRGAEQISYGFFMEPGTGKTATVLAEFTKLARAGRIVGLVVVCPNSLKDIWLSEADKRELHTALPGLRVASWPDYIEGLASPWLQTINYEAVWTGRGYDWLENALLHAHVGLVLDESIQIKNPQAKRTKVLLSLSHYAARYRRVLSGAPSVQGPQDLWSQLRFIGAWDGTFWGFRNRFCKMGGYLGKQVIGAQSEPELNALINRVAFRARKVDWLDLPKKIYTERKVTLTPQQQKHIADLEDDFTTMIPLLENPDILTPIDVQMVLTMMTKIQQIASGFVIIGEVPRPIIEPEKNPRLAILREIIDETPGKIIIFTRFRYSTKMLHDNLGKGRGPYYALKIEGGMARGDLDHMMKLFNDDPRFRVIVCQVHSAKYGLTLLGGEGDDRCHTTIFYENDYSLDARIQAEDRNHRIGQDQPVLYIDLLASKLDRHVIEALQRKTDIARAVVDGVLNK